MPRPFLETLRDLRAGLTLEELGESLAEIIDAVKKTHKAGELTLKLKIMPPKQGSINYLIVSDEVTAKIPRDDRQQTIFFPTADGGLSRQDPTQRQLPFGAATVDTDTGEITQAGVGG